MTVHNDNKKSLSGYERWELPSFNDEDVVPSNASDAPTSPDESILVERAAIKPLTAEAIEKIREDAYQEGLKQGKLKGIKAGMKAGMEEGIEQGRRHGIGQGHKQGLELGQVEAARELKAHRDALDGLCQSLLLPVESLQSELEQVLLNVVLAVSRSVINHEVKTNPEVIRRTLVDALEALPQYSDNITIKLNSADLALVRDQIKTLAPKVRIIECDSLVRGGSIVESSQNVVDHTIDRRFQKSVNAILKLALENTALTTAQAQCPETS